MWFSPVAYGTLSLGNTSIMASARTRRTIQRLYYIGPLFRRERPQRGRQRQFHQFGIETFGSNLPEQDAEVIVLAWQILSQLGLDKKIDLQLNSIGTDVCRSAYRKALKNFLNPFLKELSEVSKRRLMTNPLRILDTKIEKELSILKNAPKINDYYTEEDNEHFNEVRTYLDALDIPYNVNFRLVRGLDYYTKTVFELTSDFLGAQDALCGGGRYDNLIEDLGGKNTPAVGFAAGIERLLIAMNLKEKANIETDIYMINKESKIIPEVMNLADLIRKELGVAVYIDSLRRSMKSQLRHADKLNAKYCIIFDYEKLNLEQVYIKNMSLNEQELIPTNKLISYFEKDPKQ